MKYNWTITGGCGFIGTNLIRLILSKNLAQSITVVDNLSVGNEGEFRQVFQNYRITKDPAAKIGSYDIRLIVADIKELEVAKHTTQNTDIVVHLAANTGVQPSIEDPLADMQNNVIGTVNYLEACRANNVGKFILASSGAPIGVAEPPIHEALPCRPISPYGASKLAGEAYCSAYNGSYGLQTTALRFSNVYGPYSGKKGSVVAKFIKQALNDETWVLNGGGEQTRDFIYIDDLTRALVSAATNPKASSLYQVATNEETTIIALADMLAKVINDKFGITVKMEVGQELPGDVKRNFSDISKIQQELGWQPEMKLEQGLVEVCEWFQSLAVKAA